MELLFTLGITVFLLVLGLVSGSIAEKRHFKRLRQREGLNIQMLQTQSKIFLSPKPGGKAPTLVHSEMVVASDYFKNFLSNIRKFFGGEMKSYHSLMERARREALAKIIEQARAQGYNAVCNVRLEPADIAGAIYGKKAAVMVCIIGTATAYETTMVTTAQPVAAEPVK